MFDIYIKDFNQNGQLVTTETLVQSIPSATQGELKLISPTVKAEMGNAEAFNFSIEGGTKFYDAFNQMKTFMRVVYDGDTIFYGRVLTIENGFTGNRKIRLEGPLAFLNDTSIEGQKEEGRPNISVNAYLSKIIDNHNTMCGDSKRSFNLGEVPGNYHSASSEQQIQNAERKFGQDGWTDSKGAIEDLRSHYGGYLRVRCNGHKNSDGTYSDDGHYLDWLNHYFNTSENSQTIEVGKNVIDISTSTEIDNIFTVVIPIGNSKSTSYETADGEKKASGPKHFYVDGIEVTVPSVCSVYGNALNSGYHTYDDYAQALNKYGRIVKTVTFDDAETPAELLTKCHEWIKNNYQGEVTKFTVKAVDMHQIGDTSISKIMVGDRVRIIYPIVKEDGSVEKAQLVRTCLSINYDLYNPENNSYTFGIPANILTKSYGVTKQGKSTKDASTTPKSGGGGGGNNKEAEWLDKVTEWLSHHKICYKHKVNIISHDPLKLGMDADPNNIDSIAANSMGWNNILKDHEKGPYTGLFSDHANYFYDTQTYLSAGKFSLWKCVPSQVDSTGTKEEADKIAADTRSSLTKAGASSTAIEQMVKSKVDAYWREHPSSTTWTVYQVLLEGILSYNALMNSNILEYVKQEYGIDLRSFGSVKMPNNITYSDDYGTEVTVTNTANGVVTKEMYSPYYNPTDEDREHGYHLLTTSDGKTAVSKLDEDGEWHYTVWDPQLGTSVETTIRDLDLHVIEAADFIGTAVSQGRNPLTIDSNGEPHVYKFGQGIEKWANGEMVTAVVDGDIVRIGTTATKYASTVAQRINGNWINPVEYYVDSETGRNKAKHGSITVGTAGTTQYNAFFDKNTNQYIPVPLDYDDTMTDEERAEYLLKKVSFTTYVNKADGKTYSLPSTWNTMSFDSKKTWLLENANLKKTGVTQFVGAGMWDTENLAIKGGIYTVEDDDGKPVTYVASKQLIMGNRDTRSTIRDTLVKAGLFQDAEGNVITDASQINWDDPNFGQTLYTPTLMATNIYADQINANKAEIRVIKNEYLTSTWIKSTIANLSSVNVKQITGDPDAGQKSYATFDTFTSTSNQYYLSFGAGVIGPSPSNRNLADGLWAVKLFGPTGNDYKLKSYKYTENPDLDGSGNNDSVGHLIGTFSRAISAFSDSWSGGPNIATLTVSASPQDQTHELYFSEAKRLNGDGVLNIGGISIAYWDGILRKVPIMSYEMIGQSDTKNYNLTGLEIIVNASSLIGNITADAFVDTGESIKTEIPIRAVNSSGTVLKSNTTFKLEETAIRNPNGTVKYWVVNFLEGSTIRGRSSTTNSYNQGNSDGKTIGWNTARNSTNLVIPTTRNVSSSQMTVTYPNSSYNTHATLTYEMIEDGADDIGLVAQLSQSNAVTVAYLHHGRYTQGQSSGWNTARNSTNLVIPTTRNVSSSQMTVTYPNSSYNTHATLTYEMIEDGADDIGLVAKLSQSNAVTVAYLHHGRYTQGKNSVTASAPTYGTGPSAFNEQTSIAVYSNTSTGKSSSGTITLSKGTYTIGASGITNHCVKLQNGSTVIGLINTESVYTDGYNAGVASAVASHTITGFDTNTVSGESLTIGAREYSNNQWGYAISNSATSSVTVLAIVTSTWACDGVSKSAKSYLQRATTNIYKEGWNNCISKAIALGSVTSGGKKYYLLPDAMTKTNV